MMLLAALLTGYLVALAIGFVIEAANAYSDAPKPPAPIPPDELKALVRRHFQSAPVPDDSELRIAAALLEGQS